MEGASGRGLPLSLSRNKSSRLAESECCGQQEAGNNYARHGRATGANNARAGHAVRHGLINDADDVFVRTRAASHDTKSQGRQERRRLSSAGLAPEGLFATHQAIWVCSRSKNQGANLDRRLWGRADAL